MTALRVSDLKHPGVFLATLGGVGLLRPAPGTWGSLFALVLFVPVVFLPGWAHWLIVALAFAVGMLVTIGALAVAGVKDDRAIVVDELVGMWLPLLVVPADWRWWVAAFLLFRLFDVVKPWPVSWADRELPGAWGVMLDDVIAGILAGIVLQLSISLTGALSSPLPA